MMQDGAEKTPVVFVYGALRSGTTMFRLMLEAHAGISNPGEADFLFDYLVADASHPTGWCYDRTALEENRIFRARELDLPEGLDGLDLLESMLAQMAARRPGVLTLNVHRHAERIMATRPDVRFLHLLRDPRDVARSVIGMGWAGTLYRGGDQWIRTETAWDYILDRLRPDQVFELRYEALFADIEGSLKSVCNFLGVPFDPAMLEYHKASTYGPPDASLAEQWRHRSTPREIALVEGKAGSMMQARGYSPQGPGHVPGGIERAGLYLVDRARVWRFGLHRYGSVFLVEKLVRWLGLNSWHRRVRRRMDVAAIRHLK